MHVITSEIRAGTAWRSTQKLSHERNTRNAEGMKCWKIKYVVRRLRVKVAFKLSKDPWEKKINKTIQKKGEEIPFVFQSNAACSAS